MKKQYYVVLTYEAGIARIHGPFRTKEYAGSWALWWYGDDHWSIEPLNIYEPIPKGEVVPQTDGEQDCC